MEQIEIVKSLLADEECFEEIEMPSEEHAGQFIVKMLPYCGTEVAGCLVEMKISFLDVDSVELSYELLQDKAAGLSYEQLEDLQNEMTFSQEASESVYEMINRIQDFLGQINDGTRTVI